MVIPHSVPLIVGGVSVLLALGLLAVRSTTEDQASRIARVTAPTTSFDTPEIFEINQGGAATSHKLPFQGWAGAPACGWGSGDIAVS